MALLDAHVHMWDTAVFRLPWLSAVPTLAERYDFDAVRSPLADGIICVQAGETLLEAEWLLEQAARFPGAAASGTGVPGIDAIVLQYDPSDDPEAWAGAVHPVVVRSLASGGPVAGVRIPAHGAPDDLAAIPGVDALCAGLAANGLVLELLLRPAQLSSVAHLAERHPALTIVLCHMGIGQDPIEHGWEAELAKVATHPTVNAKISGILSAADDAGRPDDPARIVRAALACFGAGRLLFGSDWPISTRTGLDHLGIVARIDAELAGCSDEERALIYGGTAKAVYGIPEVPTTTSTHHDDRLSR
ncbi:L-fuconolactonase [Microterricola gilva]|uniref:L-fuconolactonase n=1 Tax=Microterricola gilva TaxID=393267 RepID=A0A4Q8AHG2_9MICO|nr:amidohydrolase family protein [Microterricola gilva]RZU63847.1 L-fuconolactonase [Microterricola gilva]